MAIVYIYNSQKKERERLVQLLNPDWESSAKKKKKKKKYEEVVIIN
jgi:hypothetical protein